MPSGKSMVEPANATSALVRHLGNARHQYLHRAWPARVGRYTRVRGYIGPESIMAWTASHFSRIAARRARRIGCTAQITAHIRPYNRSENNPKKHLAANSLYSVQHTHVIWLDMACVGKCVHVMWALSHDGHIRTCRWPALNPVIFLSRFVRPRLAPELQTLRAA